MKTDNKKNNQNLQKKPKELFKINMAVVGILVILHIILFFVCNITKNNYTLISLFINLFVFLGYLYILLEKTEKKLEILRREVLYMNYPLNILLFLLFLTLTILFSTICLVTVNPDAANVTFIFTFFMSTISMLMPSILLLVFIFFVVPALIIPSFKARKRQTAAKTIIITLIVILSIISLFNIINRIQIAQNFDKQGRFRVSRLTVKYATNFLKIHNSVSPRAKQLMSADTLKVPFLYTSESNPFDDYTRADRFCRALNASVPNYLEAYHIVFNRFDTFGEKYYWTSDKDGLNEEYPLVLHYKNMSYEIVRKPANVRPELYCVAPASENYGIKDEPYFYRNFDLERKEDIQTMLTKKFNRNFFNEISKVDNNHRQVVPPPPENKTIRGEKKHVNFSVKEVNQEVFNQLIQAGYAYNPTLSISQNYEIPENSISTGITEKTKHIRLCFYPFMEYGDMGIFKEKEIWEQNFCSPSFDVISMQPELKTRHEKDSYCFSKGGRLPNIAELTGILKTYGINQTNVRFWTNIKVRDAATGSTLPVYVFYKDSRFMNVG